MYHDIRLLNLSLRNLDRSCDEQVGFCESHENQGGYAQFTTVRGDEL